MDAARKLRGAHAVDDELPTGGAASPGPKLAQDCLPPILQEDRLYYWQRMSSIVRIQKWWKQIFSRRLIHAKAVQRRHELAEMLEGECASTIQAAWRRFHTEKNGEVQ